MAKIDFKNNPIIQTLAPKEQMTTGEWIVEHKAGNWDLDPDPDFPLSMDEKRYERCHKLALQLKKQYPITDDLPLEEIIRRERLIVTALVNKIHEEENYWNYNRTAAASEDEHESSHNDIKRAHDEDPNNQPEAKEFKPGEFMCRHYAPIMASLCTAAGIELLDISCGVHFYHVVDGKLALSNTDLNCVHESIVSRRTLSIIEATNTEGQYAYKQQMNGLTLNKFIAGNTLVVANDTTVSVFSTGYHSEDQKALIEKRLHQIESGADLLKLAYDDRGYTRKEQDDAFKKMAEHSKTLAECTLKDKVAPTVALMKKHIKAGDWDKVRALGKTFAFTEVTFGKALEKAVASADLKATDAILESVPIHENKLSKLFVQSIKNDQLDVAGLLLQKGAVMTKADAGQINKADMARVLSKSARTQQNIEMAFFAIDHGALEGFSRGEVLSNEKTKIRLLFWDTEKEPQDKIYTDKLMCKLQVSPEAALAYCHEKKWGKNAHLVEEIISDRKMAAKLQAQEYVTAAAKDIHAAFKTLGSLNYMGLDKLVLPFIPKPHGLSPK